MLSQKKLSQSPWILGQYCWATMGSIDGGIDGTASPSSVQLDFIDAAASQHPPHTTWLGTFDTTARICENTDPSSSDSSPPRDPPVTPIRSPSISGWAASQSRASPKYSSGISTSCSGRSGALK